MFCRPVCFHHSWFRPLILPHCQRRIWGHQWRKKTGAELRSSEASLDRLYRQKLVTVFLLFFFLLERHSWKKKKECEGNEKYVQIVTLVMGLAFPAWQTAITGQKKKRKRLLWLHGIFKKRNIHNSGVEQYKQSSGLMGRPSLCPWMQFNQKCHTWGARCSVNSLCKSWMLRSRFCWAVGLKRRGRHTIIKM